MSAYNNIEVEIACPKCTRNETVLCQTHVASSFDGNSRGRFLLSHIYFGTRNDVVG